MCVPRRRTDQIVVPGIREVEHHVETRLRCFFLLGAVLQAISEETGMPRELLLDPGDQRALHEQSLHFAKVRLIRVGEVNPRLSEINQRLYQTLVRLIGDEQIVPIAEYRLNEVTAAIDRLPFAIMLDMALIDFSLDPLNAANPSNCSRIYRILDTMHSALIWNPLFSRTALDWIAKTRTPAGIQDLFRYVAPVYQAVLRGQVLPSIETLLESPMLYDNLFSESCKSSL